MTERDREPLMPECDHDWELIRDWYGDPDVINGTADCSFFRCRKCDGTREATYTDVRDYEDARHG